MQEHQVEIELPSQGKLYNGRIPEGKVSIRPLATRDEKILGDTKQMNDIINAYLDRALILPEGFSQMELLSGDRVYALYAVRSLSYGPDYEFRWRCEACGNQSYGSVHIPELGIRRLPKDASEPFECELPQSKYIVGFRLFRGADEEAVVRTMKQKKPGEAKDTIKVEQLARCLMHVKSPDGSVDKVFDTNHAVGMYEAKQFLNSLYPWDTNELLAYSDSLDPGMDTEVAVTCENRFCMRDSIVDLPTTAEFFRAPRHRRKNSSSRTV